MKIWEDPVSTEWRKWFAWRPIRTENREWVWLETVERRWYTARIPNVVPGSWIIYRRIN